MWPTENDYLKAVTRVNPAPFSLLNEKKIKVIKDINDAPVIRSGNNTVVFKVTMNDELYALKCYTKEINNQIQYLAAIEKYVDDINSEWIVPFHLYESEVYVIKSEHSFHGMYCALLMPWIEGETLYRYVKKCCEEKNTIALQEIFKQFQQMALWILQQPFVHGDFAAENIIVTPEGKLVLTDHDNILFDELKFTSGHSLVNEDYQHPKRNLNIINLAADHIGILVIAISLRAVQFKPALFFTYTNESGLLFTAKSLREGEKSLVYKELLTINDTYLQNLLHLFKIFIHKKTIEVPMLSTCIRDLDPQLYSRLLEIEVKELKKDLENSALRIQNLQSEFSEELIVKEELFIENKKLKETIIEVEGIKKKKAALKRSISLGIAGLTCVAVLSGITFYYITSKQENVVAEYHLVKPLTVTEESLLLKKDSVTVNDLSTTASNTFEKNNVVSIENAESKQMPETINPKKESQ